MKPRRRSWTGAVAWLVAAAVSFGLIVASGAAQTKANAGTVRVLMVSDIHFEPFWDPAKAQQLAAAPLPQWEAILSAPDSADRAQQFESLQQKCRARGEDTSYPLLRSSLAAMKAAGSGVKFVTLSGDLMAHSFDCKFNAAVMGTKPGDYDLFVQKTIGFLESELHKTFPAVPVYAALGNNDSNCADYELDADSPFLAEAGSLMTADLPKAGQPAALRSFTAEGDYSVALPAPMRGARLLVIDNMFLSARYKSCGGKPNPASGQAQLAWLRAQLETARQRHEKIWVMGHIPPGIDPYSTVRRARNICADGAPTSFLSSDALGETLAEFGDVVHLAIFAHTHMDELRLLAPAPARDAAAAGPAVALKMVPSISPVDGNNPSFVVAQVNTETATLKDYRVIAASNQTGVDAKWTEEYAFDKEFHQTAFDAVSVAAMIAGFRADPQAQTAASQNYLKNYFVGDVSLALRAFWPQYVCALSNRTAETYRACVCGGTGQDGQAH